MDAFSQPSISPHIEHRGLRTSPAIDVETGFDLGTGEGQARCLRIFNNDRPQILMLSPPCTVFSQIQRTHQNRRKDYEDWQQKYCEGLNLWRFGLLLFERQVLQGRLAVIEHPAQASSRRLPETRRLLANSMAVQCSDFNQCLFGLVMQMEVHRQRVHPKMHGGDM